jgi:hypothetical protein
MSHLTCRCLNSNLGHFSGSTTFILFRLENRVCLSHGMQVAGAAWWAATMIMAGVGDLVQRTGNDRIGRVLDGRIIERSGDAVCSWHRGRGDEERGFLS